MNRSHPWRVLSVMAAIAVLSYSDATAQPITIARPIPTGLRLDLTRTDRYVAKLEVRSTALPPLWVDSSAVKLPRYPFMADPRRWPRLFANTTECTLSLNPITRRHWWQG